MIFRGKKQKLLGKESQNPFYKLLSRFFVQMVHQLESIMCRNQTKTTTQHVKITVGAVAICGRVVGLWDCGWWTLM